MLCSVNILSVAAPKTSDCPARKQARGVDQADCMHVYDRYPSAEVAETKPIKLGLLLYLRVETVSVAAPKTSSCPARKTS